MLGPLHRLCQPIVDYFRARGGDVKLNARLKTIRLNPDDTVAGYELTDGEVVTGDIYASAMPGRLVFFVLLPTLEL